MNNDIVILREAIKKIIPMLAGKGLVVTQIGTQAYVQPHPVTGLPWRVNIPLLPDNAEPDFVMAIQGFIDHEVAHVLYTDFTFKAREKSKRLHNLHNIIEDTMIERLMGEDFPGSKRNIARLREYFLRNVTVPAIKSAGSKQDEFDYLIVVMFRALAGHTEFQQYMDDNNYWEHPLVKAFMQRFSQASKDKMPLLADTAQTYDIAVEVEAILYPPPPPAPPAPPEQPPEEEEDKSDGEGSDDQEQSESEGEDDQDHSDEEQTGDGEGKGEREHTEDNDKASGGEGEDEDESEKEKDEDAGEGDSDGQGEEEAEEDGTEGAGDDSSDGSDDDEADEAEGKGSGDKDDSEEGAADDADDQNGSGSETDDANDEGDQNDADVPDADDGEGSEPEESDADAEKSDGEAESDGGETGDKPEPGGSNAESADAEGDDTEEGEDDSEQGGKPDLSNLAIEDDNDGKEETEGEEAPEDEENFEVNGIGYDKNVNPFEEMTDDALNEKDLSSALVKIIVKQAIAACRAADYSIFTREYDVIKTLQVPEDFKSRWTVELEEETRSLTGVMQKDIERMMAAQSRVFNVAGQRSGKLNSAGLHRLSAGDARVFSRREEIRAKDTAVSLLADCSGSMKGLPMSTAMSASYALAQVLERCNIPSECMGFTTASMWGAGGVLTQTQMEEFNDALQKEVAKSKVKFSRIYPIYMPIFKDFNERINAEVKKRFAYQRRVQANMGGNIDGESLEYAAMRLAKRKEKRKVIIVLSDGFPAGAENDDEHLKMMVQRLTKQGFDLVGVGIKSEAVARFYDNYLILNSVEELPRAVMGELKKILTK
jgi:hypothetical protein